MMCGVVTMMLMYQRMTASSTWMHARRFRSVSYFTLPCRAAQNNLAPRVRLSFRAKWSNCIVVDPTMGPSRQTGTPVGATVC
ncbi:MAG: hypothetical protein ACR2FI_03640 [Burkholderiales bacterium]|nr:hypothetical protein [Pseudomonadota bacterium]